MNYSEYVAEATKKAYETSVEDTERLIIALKTSTRVFTAGNGGSMASAIHFAQDLTKFCNIPSISLSNISNITAYANDINYSSVFVEQMKVLSENTDTLFLISGSGNSPNLLAVADWADENRVLTLSLTGGNGGKLKAKSDVNLNIPCWEMGMIEGIHSLILHYIVQRLHEKASKNESKPL